VFAERIHRIHQAFGGQGRQHLVADVLDVVVGPARVLRRQGMGRQAGGCAPSVAARRQAPGHAQHLALVGQVQAVAGLDLEVVTPSRIRHPLAALANSSSSLAARVARTVLAMPPPWAAISA
jgi:hypothetical protein